MRADAEAAYVEYVRIRMPWLRRLAFRLCGDWTSADDLLQDCLVKLYRHWHRTGAADSPDAYVRTMLVRTFLADRRRSWLRWVRAVADLPSGGSEQTNDGSADGRLDLRAALARLSPGQRAVLVLRYWEDLDVAQAAAHLGCSPGTVKSQTGVRDRGAAAAASQLCPRWAGGTMTDDDIAALFAAEPAEQAPVQPPNHLEHLVELGRRSARRRAALSGVLWTVVGGVLLALVVPRIRTPSLVKTVSKALVNFASRSRRRNFTVDPRSARSMSRLRAC
jgi:RNA polymerase sigma-70 factor (sigma-E family)